LQYRVAELGAPIQMCDALSRNTPKLSDSAEILLANCLAHGRRQFVEVAANFPEECRYDLETLGGLYKYDAEAREGMPSPAPRLRFHQQHSGPVTQQLHQWLEAQFALRQVEPNSGLGKAITYLLRHWKGLTFLREAGGRWITTCANARSNVRCCIARMPCFIELCTAPKLAICS
jgi:transposase